MRYVELLGERVSKIGLGTWQFGSFEWGYGGGYAAGDAPAIVARALEKGVNLFDTAEIYGFGNSERILGSALAGNRGQAFIASKVWPWLAVGPLVRSSGRGSARRLGVRTIDLYQLHWPSPHIPLASTMAGMRRLQSEGTVRQVGVSNYGLDRWRRAEAALGSAVFSNQVPYSLVVRAPEQDLIPHTEAGDRLLLAYSPLGQGFLGGRYRGGVKAVGAARSRNPAFLKAAEPTADALLDGLAEIAAHHGATSAQVALAWVIRHPNVVAIPGARTLEQMDRNAEAADLVLTADEVHRLSEAATRFLP